MTKSAILFSLGLVTAQFLYSKIERSSPQNKWIHIYLNKGYQTTANHDKAQTTWASQSRHNERDGISNHLHLECLFNRLFRCRSNKTSKLCVTGLCEGNPPVTGGFPSQRASNAENVSIWWRHHGMHCGTSMVSYLHDKTSLLFLIWFTWDVAHTITRIDFCVQPPLKFEHGWVIISHRFMWMLFFIHALILMRM